ncbi:NfeD family protein [Pseudobowmanella zhangzhouensis]
MNLGWVAYDWTSAFISLAVISAVITAALWKPMKNLQNQTDDPAKPHSDFVGVEFDLTSELSSKQVSSYKYSGILWAVRAGVPIPETLPSGTKVRVVSVEVGTLYVAPAE